MMRGRSTSGTVPPVSGQPHQGLNVLLDAWSVDRAIGDVLTRALSPSGLTADAFTVDSLLARQGRLTPSHLAEQMAAPPTTVSGYVTRLEAHRHITRERNARGVVPYRTRDAGACSRTWVKLAAQTPMFTHVPPAVRRRTHQQAVARSEYLG